MCGHEHQHRGKQISDLDNRAAILYLENDSLQQGEEQSFSVLVFDDTDLTNAVLYTISIDAKKDVCLPIAEKNVPITYHVILLTLQSIFIHIFIAWMLQLSIHVKTLCYWMIYMYILIWNH